MYFGVERATGFWDASEFIAHPSEYQAIGKAALPKKSNLYKTGGTIALRNCIGASLSGETLRPPGPP